MNSRRHISSFIALLFVFLTNVGSLHAQRIERVGGFDPTQLAKGLGQVTFRPHAQGRYAFDWGTWEWYRRSVKLDPYYAPFAPNYIAPWKLVPCGETDYVTACFEGDYKKIDVNKIRFATAPDGDALEAVYDPKILGWRISLHATEHGHTYNIYALYKGQVIGKLRVVSYRAQHHTVTIVPVNNAQPDTASIERYLNRVYGPVGVRFTVHLDERMRGNVSWSAAGDGRLSLVGLDLFGNEAERRESPDMRRLQAAYAQAVGGIEAGSGCYLFVLDGESGLDPAAHLLGEMPRRSRFGYLFSPDGRGMERTIAHELGHGLFTLQHTFDDEYGGAESRGTTQNLMDYGTEADTALAAFQWNIMASPAVFTLLDDGEDGQIRRIEVGPHLFTLRTYHNLRKPIVISYPNGELDQTFMLFDYKFQNRVFVSYATERMQVQNGAWILPNITFSKHSKHSKFHNATFYQVIISDVGEINCLSEKDRDMIYSYLTGQNDEPIFDQYELTIKDKKKYNFALMYKELEQQKRELISSGKYQQLSAEERIILDLPLIMWLKQYYYGAIFMYNWLIGGGDIEMDDAMFAFLDKWEKKTEAEQEFMQFFESQKNNAIGKEIEKDGHKIFALNDVKQYIAQSSADTIRFDSQNFSDGYLNFARCNILTKYFDDINDPHVAAFGTMGLSYIFEGVYDANNKHIKVTQVIQRIKDGFDFEDKDENNSQPLGVWNSSIFEFDSKINKIKIIPSSKKVTLYNKTFRLFRENTGLGRDFSIIGRRKVHSILDFINIDSTNDTVVYK